LNAAINAYIVQTVMIGFLQPKESEFRNSFARGRFQSYDIKREGNDLNASVYGLVNGAAPARLDLVR